MNVPHWIARRYLRPRRFSVITMIGAISVVGIVIGTAALVIVMSLFNGFRGVARDLMIGFGPHLQVVSAKGARLGNADALERSILSAVNARVAQTISSRLVLLAGDRTGVVSAVGVASDTLPTLEGPRRSVFVGSFATESFDGIPSITIASGVAEQLGLFIGDTVRMLAPETIESGLRTMTMPRGQQAVVRAIFQSNAAREVDHSRVYLSAGVLGGLTRDERPSSIDLMVASPLHASELAAALRALLPKHVEVRTWEDLNRGLMETMRLESMGSFIVLALIVLVASFNVLVSLTLGVVEKRRDIAVLLTIGLQPRDIRRMYLVQGLTLGSVAVVLGVAIGLLVSWGQITFQWITFDMSAGFLVPALPMEIQAVDVILTAAVGLALAATAAIYPASRAARTIVAEAIRVE